MKALLADGCGTISVTDLSIPKIGDYDALVKISGCVFCNATDQHIVNRSMPFELRYPCVLGHEAFGVVTAVGRCVRNFKEGDRAFRPCAVYPGECRDGVYSAWGGFAEFGMVYDLRAAVEDGVFGDPASTPLRNQFPLAPDISDEDAAAMIVYREAASALWRIPELRGRSVLILGSGAVGISMCRFAKMLGAEFVGVVGRRKLKLDKALAAGADDAFFADSDWPPGRDRYDILVDTTGSYGLIEKCSCVLRAGADICEYAVYPKDAELPGHLSCRFNAYRIDPEESNTALWVESLVRHRLLQGSMLVTHHFPFADVQAAYELVVSGDCVKAVVLFDDCRSA